MDLELEDMNNYSYQDLDEVNKIDLQNWVDTDQMEGLICEESGGIVGYINSAHVDKITAKLNGLFRLNITFSHYGSKDTIPYKDYVVDNSEFEGTDEEFHSGSFEVQIHPLEDESIVDIVKAFINHKDLRGECFSVSVNDVLLFTEEDINFD